MQLHLQLFQGRWRRFGFEVVQSTCQFRVIKYHQVIEIGDHDIWLHGTKQKVYDIEHRISVVSHLIIHLSNRNVL